MTCKGCTSWEIRNVLRPFLVEESVETTKSDSEAETENPGLVKRLGQGIGGLFNRGHDSDEEEQNDLDETTQLSSEHTHQTIEDQVTEEEVVSAEKTKKPGHLQTLCQPGGYNAAARG